MLTYALTKEMLSNALTKDKYDLFPVSTRTFKYLNIFFLHSDPSLIVSPLLLFAEAKSGPFAGEDSDDDESERDDDATDDDGLPEDSQRKHMCTHVHKCNTNAHMHTCYFGIPVKLPNR